MYCFATYSTFLSECWCNGLLKCLFHTSGGALSYRQLRARRALLQIKDVPLRTRRALLPLTLYSDSALLALNWRYKGIGTIIGLGLGFERWMFLPWCIKWNICRPNGSKPPRYLEHWRQQFTYMASVCDICALSASSLVHYQYRARPLRHGIGWVCLLLKGIVYQCFHFKVYLYPKFFCVWKGHN